MNKKLSIVTIGSAKGPELYATIESFLDTKDDFFIWVFVVYNEYERKLLES